MDRESADSVKLLRANSVDSSGVGHAREDCLQCCRRRIDPSSGISSSSRSEFFNSSESSFSDEVDRTRASILRHVQRMANPVWSKQSRTQLLELKQKHPSAFQDICLYSEVCQQLGRNTYRLGSRRFLQELFLDLDFGSFYREPGEISTAKADRFNAAEHVLPLNGEMPSPSGSKLIKSPGALKGFGGISASVRTNFSMVLPSMADDVTRNNNPPTSSVAAGGSGGTSVDSGNNGISDSSGVQAGPVPLKPHHLRSPPMASLYETSVENLAEMSSTPKGVGLRVQIAQDQIERVSLGCDGVH